MTNAQIMALLNPGIALVFALTFFVFWSRERSRTYILAFGTAYFLMSTGFLLSHLFGSELVLVDALKAACFGFGSVSLVWGACTRVRQPVSLPLIASIAALEVICGSVTKFILPTMDASLMIANAAYGTVFLIGAIAIAKAKCPTAVDRLVLAMFVLTILQFYVRPTISLAVDGGISADVYRQSSYFAVLNATIVLVSLLLALSLIAACVSDILADLKEATSRDHLSGLRNRGAFETGAAELIEHRGRNPLPMSLIIGDIDHFKSINDTYGHQRGDDVISAFGKLVAETVRECDLAGRVGGEEFCVLAQNADLGTAHLLAERIRLGFEQVSVEGLPVDKALSASFGVTELMDGETFSQAYARADAALYDAKHAGRNRVRAAAMPEVIELQAVEAVAA